MKNAFFSFALLALVSATHATKDDAIVLKMNAKLDDRTEYRISINIQSESLGKVSATLHAADRITAIKKGNFVQSMYIAGSSGMGTGTLATIQDQITGIKNFAWERTVDSRGRVMGTSNSSAPAAATSIDLVFPDRAVSKGDTWSENISIQGQDVEVSYKLSDFNKSEAVITATAQKPGFVETIKPYRFVVNRATGRYRSASGTLGMSFGDQKLQVSFLIKMLVPVQPQSFWKEDGR
jgi:hypothetical protein